jgi:hypothetical protein
MALGLSLQKGICCLKVLAFISNNNGLLEQRLLSVARDIIQHGKVGISVPQAYKGAGAKISTLDPLGLLSTERELRQNM